MSEDYFEDQGTRHPVMRTLLEREAQQRSARFGLPRRDLLNSALGALAATSIVQQIPRFRSRLEAQAGFVPPAEDCYAELQAQHATFTRIDASSALDWQMIEATARAQQATVADTVLDMLRVTQTLYCGFAVDQLTHMTQSATRARRANASDEQILVALIHDIGKVIGNANHPEIAGALARPCVSDDAYRSLRHHMEFQWQHYGQMVGVPTDGRKRYIDQPWYTACARFTDEWDQTSFDAKYDTLPLAEFEPLVREVLVVCPKPSRGPHRTVSRPHDPRSGPQGLSLGTPAYRPARHAVLHVAGDPGFVVHYEPHSRAGDLELARTTPQARCGLRTRLGVRAQG